MARNFFAFAAKDTREQQAENLRRWIAAGQSWDGHMAPREHEIGAPRHTKAQKRKIREQRR
jgi:hypothetical protein